MKTFRFLTLAVIALLAGGFLQSCNDDDDGPSGSGSAKKLLGTWKLEREFFWGKINGKIDEQRENEYGDYDRSYIIRFNADGTFWADYGTCETIPDGTPDSKTDGTYTYENGKLTFVHNDAARTTTTTEVKTLNATTFVHEYYVTWIENGKNYEFYDEETYRKIGENE